MAKAIFYIKDKVQDAGYRLFIMSKILNSDLEGTAINTPDGRIKVLLAGEKEHILQFYEELKKEKPELAENPTSTKLEFNESLIIPGKMPASQDLLLNQFSKGVGFLAKMDKKLDELPTRLEKKLDELPERLKPNFDELGKKLDELPERLKPNFDELGKKLDELPTRLEKKLDELPTRLEKKLDELPRKIAVAIKE
ncbi:acylphosphatase [archaeon]|nr:acylphosphatase [archaeon]